MIRRKDPKADGREKGSNSSEESAPAEPKFPRPKVILVDMPEGSAELLRASGFNIGTGTFGQPFSVERANGYRPVYNEAALPGYPEQEIVVLDQLARIREDAPEVEMPPIGQHAFWARMHRGRINPRPLGMRATRDELNRIYLHGGIVIVFAGPRIDAEYVYGTRTRHGVNVLEEATVTSWHLLPVMEDFTVNADVGEEIYLPEKARLPSLASHLEQATFECTFSPPSWLEDRWFTLATNKYDDPVAGILFPDKDEDAGGFVFILPRIGNPGEAVDALLKETLPRLRLPLFPHFEGARWIRRPEYELPEVLDVEQRIKEVEATAREKVRELEQNVEELRKEKGFLSDILTSTGDGLVVAVKETLEFLGVEKVINVDEESGDQSAGDLREDLEITDREPAVLVEIKGVGGRASEGDALQVGKYVAPRMKERKTTEIRGLSIINTERHLPALDRDNAHAFTGDAVTSAEAQDIGLLTAWDLYRLARNYDRLGWRPEMVRDLFYRSGHIDPVPAHYEFVGVVFNYFEKPEAVAIEIEQGEIAEGDVLAFETPIDFIEEKVESLEQANQAVEKAAAGEQVASRTKLAAETELRKGLRVYRVGDPPGA